MAIRAIPCGNRCGGGCGWWDTTRAVIHGLPDTIVVWVAFVRCTKCGTMVRFDAKQAQRRLKRESGRQQTE